MNDSQKKTIANARRRSRAAVERAALDLARALGTLDGIARGLRALGEPIPEDLGQSRRCAIYALGSLNDLRLKARIPDVRHFRRDGVLSCLATGSSPEEAARLVEASREVEE